MAPKPECVRCEELQDFVDTHFSNGESYAQGFAAGLRAASPDPQLLERISRLEQDIAQLEQDKAALNDALNQAAARAKWFEHWLAQYSGRQSRAG